MIDWKSSSPQKTFDDAMESTVDIELQGQEGVAATYAGVEIVFQDISVSVKGNKKNS